LEHWYNELSAVSFLTFEAEKEMVVDVVDKVDLEVCTDANGEHRQAYHN
jgi:hypothetical protein